MPDHVVNERVYDHPDSRRQPFDGEPPSPSVCDWLQSLAEPARNLFAVNQCLAQEHVGWEFLATVTVMDYYWQKGQTQRQKAQLAMLSPLRMPGVKRLQAIAS